MDRQKMLARFKQTGELVEIEEHPLLLAINSSNPFFTVKATRKLSQIYIDLVGESFLLKERNVAGKPIGLWPLPPHWITDTPTPSDPFYEVLINGTQADIPSTEMLWIKETDPLNPYGRGTGFAVSLGDELQAYENASKTVNAAFYNRGLPEVIISPEDNEGGWGENDVRKIEAQWRNKVQGFMKWFKPMFLRRKISVNVLPQDFRALQMLELTQHERDTIIAVFGIPPEKLGIIANSNRATSEVADLTMAKDVVVPRLELLRECYQERLVPEYDDRLIVDYDSPVMGDKEHALKVATAAPHAFMVDEWREMGEHEPLDDGKGQIFMVSAGVSAKEDLSEASASPLPMPPQLEPPEDDDKARLLTDGESKADLLNIEEVEPIVLIPHKQLSDLDDDSDFYLNVHRAAEKREARTRKIFTEAAKNAQESVDLDAMEAAIVSNMLRAAEDAINWDAFEEDLKELRGVLEDALNDSGGLAEDELTQLIDQKARLDQTVKSGQIVKVTEPIPFAESTRVEAWMNLHIAELVTGIGEETRAAIREMILTGLKDNLPPRELARIVRNAIGMTQRQALAAERFHAKLLEDGVDAARAVERTRRVQEAFIRQRARMIARTETLTATNMGQQLLWEEKAADGTLDTKEMRKVVIITNDDRLDFQVCEPMPFLEANQDLRVDDAFTTGIGTQKLQPPFHPNCRCTSGLELKKE
jgi:hypothetical protein